VEKFLKAHQQVADELALFMTADIRNRARGDGWDDGVVERLRVVKDGEKYSVTAPSSVGDAAWVSEFGDAEKLPTATVRRYDTSGGKVGEFYNTRMSRYLYGGKN